MSKLEKELSELKTITTSAYEEGVTIPQAEKLAAKTLLARMELADAIQAIDLDARMKKQGAKAVRGDVYLKEVKAHEKKPTESALESAVNLNTEVLDAELAFAEAETSKNRLSIYEDVVKDAHIYFRTIAKGSFD